MLYFICSWLHTHPSSLLLLPFFVSQLCTTSQEERKLIRAFQRRGILPISLSPVRAEAPGVFSTFPSWHADAAAVPGCDNDGRVAGDVERILAVVTALQYRINSARQYVAEAFWAARDKNVIQRLPPIETLPVYVFGISAGTMLSSRILSHLQVTQRL